MHIRTELPQWHHFAMTQSVIYLSPRRPRSVHAGFVVEQVALGQGFSLSTTFHNGSPYSYIIWGMNNRPTGGCSSETPSHPIDNNNLTTYPNTTQTNLTQINLCNMTPATRPSVVMPIIPTLTRFQIKRKRACGVGGIKYKIGFQLQSLKATCQILPCYGCGSLMETSWSIQATLLLWMDQLPK
jgi:hypothetical protein